MIFRLIVDLREKACLFLNQISRLLNKREATPMDLCSMLDRSNHSLVWTLTFLLQLILMVVFSQGGETAASPPDCLSA